MTAHNLCALTGSNTESLEYSTPQKKHVFMQSIVTIIRSLICYACCVLYKLLNAVHSVHAPSSYVYYTYYTLNTISTNCTFFILACNVLM